MSFLQRLIEIVIPSLTFLLMIVVGIDLTREDFRAVRSKPRALIVGTLGQYLLPVVALILILTMRLRPEIAGGLILIAASPCGGISNYYTYLARWNVALSVTLTAISCLIAPVSMPLLLKAFESALGQDINFHVPLRYLVGQLVLILVLPVVLGIVLRRFQGDRVLKHQKIFRKLSMIGLALLIGFILYQTRELLAAAWSSIVISSACFVVLSLLLGYFIGFLFRLEKVDSYTILIEFGVRNLAIATTAAVVVLKRTEFAAFAAMYFLTESALILFVIILFTKLRRSLALVTS